MLKALWNDEAGAVIAAELVLVLTIVVIGLIVGLVELQSSIVNELNDVAEAIGSLNQSFFVSGSISQAGNHIKAFRVGSQFIDHKDDCDCNECALICTGPAVPEAPHP